MKKPLLILLFIFFEIFNLRIFHSCKFFADTFYFSGFDLKLRLIEAINNTQNLPIPAIRLFDNKVIGTLLDLIRKDFLFWNSDFLVMFLSFAGILFFFSGIYFGILKREKVVIYSLIFLFIFQVAEVFIKIPISFQVKIIILLGPYLLVSVFGFSKIYMKFGFSKTFIILIASAFITLWWNSVYILNPYCS